MAKTYTLKKGESLLQIAKQNGISYDSLLAANPGVRSGTPGVVLRLPTTQLGGADPKSPWTPDLPQPDPKGTYTPPPPPANPYGRRPTPVRPPGPIAPTPQPTYTPPVVGYTGAQTPPPAPVVTYTGAQPAPTPPPVQNQALIPGAFQVGQAVAPYIADRFGGYLNRLFNRGAIARNLRGVGDFFDVSDQARQYENNPALGPVFGLAESLGQLPAAGARALATSVSDTGPGVTQRQPGRNVGLAGPAPNATRAIAESEAEINPELGHITYRMMLADGTVGRSNIYSMSSEDVGADGRLTLEAIEKYEDQRAEHVGMSLLRRQKPQIIMEHDRLANGISRDEMLEMGYYFNPDTDVWEYGQPIGDEPQIAGAAMPYSGYGYGYGGGGPRYSYPKGGGGTYTPYFDYTQPGARGRIPQQIQNNPARFGMVTWRI